MDQPFNKILVVKNLVSKYQNARKTAAAPYEIRAEKLFILLIGVMIATSLCILDGYEKWVSLLLVPVYVIIKNTTKNSLERLLANLIWGGKIKRSQNKIQVEAKKELNLYRKHLILMAKRHKNWGEVFKQASKIIDINQ